MNPDFSKNTIETLAKRASFICSNPDCRVATVGPGDDSEKSMSIGEAAHIYGARPKAARFDADMSDVARAEITNGIWLCRNCHRTIDQSPARFPASLLFVWREQHDRYVTQRLGSRSDEIRDRLTIEELEPFQLYPARIQRIVRDKPDGWEWRLTSEILRHLNKPLFGKLHNLEAGLYNRLGEHLEEAELFDWMQKRIAEQTALVPPFVALLDELTASWGAPGEAGDVDRLHEVCLLLNQAIAETVAYEERVQQALIPVGYEGVSNVVSHHLARQVLKLEGIPDRLDEALRFALVEEKRGRSEPLQIVETIVFELPDWWEKHAMRVAKDLQEGNIPPIEAQSTMAEVEDVLLGWAVIGAIGMVIYWLVF